MESNDKFFKKALLAAGTVFTGACVIIGVQKRNIAESRHYMTMRIIGQGLTLGLLFYCGKSLVEDQNPKKE